MSLPIQNTFARPQGGTILPQSESQTEASLQISVVPCINVVLSFCKYAYTLKIKAAWGEFLKCRTLTSILFKINIKIWQVPPTWGSKGVEVRLVWSEALHHNRQDKVWRWRTSAEPTSWCTATCRRPSASAACWAWSCCERWTSCRLGRRYQGSRCCWPAGCSVAASPWAPWSTDARPSSSGGRTRRWCIPETDQEEAGSVRWRRSALVFFQTCYIPKDAEGTPKAKKERRIFHCMECLLHFKRRLSLLRILIPKPRI